MPKRRRENEEESVETGNVDEGDFSNGEDDTDEEQADKYMLNDEDIEGQEDRTVEFDGEVQITPFNMQEEMEEGHFDKEGMYIFSKRDKDEIKDHWLDNIDWVKVNSQTASARAKIENAGEELKSFNYITCYKEMLEIIKPGETVLKALKRLGGNKIQTASERWKKKKAGEMSNSDGKDKEQILKLTELADEMLSQTGNMDVYQETFEGIRFKIQQADVSKGENKSEAELDMFADEFDEKPKTVTEDDEPATKKVRFNDEEKVTVEEKAPDEVQWQFKWENSEAAEIHGPHTSQEMQDWVEQGYFDSGVWVRRVGQSGEFYTSKRIDFELYL